MMKACVMLLLLAACWAIPFSKFAQYDAECELKHLNTCKIDLYTNPGGVSP